MGTNRIAPSAAVHRKATNHQGSESNEFPTRYTEGIGTDLVVHFDRSEGHKPGIENRRIYCRVAVGIERPNGLVVDPQLHYSTIGAVKTELHVTKDQVALGRTRRNPRMKNPYATGRGGLDGPEWCSGRDAL